jgi:hypothetical protein
MAFVLQHSRHGNVIAVSKRPSHSWKHPVPKEYQFATEAEAMEFLAENVPIEWRTSYSIIERSHLTGEGSHARRQKKAR